jgi:hypothetical protein
VYAGHVGIAIGAKGLRKTIPLWLLIVASQLPDWADASLCLANIRTPIPGMYSHSLPAIGILALAAAAAYCVIERDVAGIILVIAVVVSHAAGDYLTGLKPTWSGGPVIGLELYHRPVIDFLVESAVILGGWLLYRRSLPLDRRYSRQAFEMIAVLIVIQAGADVFMAFAKGLRKC